MIGQVIGQDWRSVVGGVYVGVGEESEQVFPGGELSDVRPLVKIEQVKGEVRNSIGWARVGYRAGYRVGVV